jgi:xanthine dehydrogenase molybdopterin-binding subunit B
MRISFTQPHTHQSCSDGERNLTHYNQKVDSDLAALWQKCIDVSGYEERLASVEAFNKANRWRKRGLAMVPAKFGLAFTFTTLNQASSLVHIYTDGSVLVNHGGIEMGQGLHTKVLQVAAHALQIPLSQVHLQDTSTEKVCVLCIRVAVLLKFCYLDCQFFCYCRKHGIRFVWNGNIGCL